MSRRKSGDNAHQELMPFVERIEPPGTIRNTPESPRPRTRAKVESDPAPPSPEPAPTAEETTPYPHIHEGRFEFRQLKIWWRSTDGRPWHIKVGDTASRHLIARLIVWLLTALTALIGGSTRPVDQSPDSGWTTTIERSK